MTELSGYNFKRQEFEIEYDNDAEQLLADMEFKDTDTKTERELKLRVLHIYSKRYLSTTMCMHVVYILDMEKVDDHRHFSIKVSKKEV